MTQPIVGSAASIVYERVAPAQPDDEQRGWALLLLVAALTAPIEVVEDWVRDWPDGKSGQAHILDVDTAPARWLSWQARFAGVVLTPGMTEDQQRALIRDRPAERRGTLGAYAAAARHELIDPERSRVRLDERYGGNIDLLRVATYTDQTPDPSRVLVALKRAKEVGLLLQYDVVDGWDISELEADFDGRTIADLEAAYASISDLEHVLPPWSIGEMERSYVGRSIGDLERVFPTVHDLETEGL